jgi:hypothetical protein
MKYIDACWLQPDVIRLYRRYTRSKNAQYAWMDYRLSAEREAECAEMLRWDTNDTTPALYCADQALLEALGCLDSGLL